MELYVCSRLAGWWRLRFHWRRSDAERGECVPKPGTLCALALELALELTGCCVRVLMILALQLVSACPLELAFCTDRLLCVCL